MSRFDFLKTDYEDLYKLCIEAEQNQNMNKARQVLEIIARRFGATKRHLFDRIGEISDKEFIPLDVVNLFHQVRIIGNKGSHGIETTDTEMKDCLNALFEIVVWLAIAHDKKTYHLTTFVEEDLPIVQKYQPIKSKHDTIKDLGIDVNPLEVDYNKLAFDNAAADELDKDVFETDEEYERRIYDLPLHHIGYAILDKRAQDNYTGLTFAMFHIERENKIIFSDINAFTAQMDTEEDYFIDGKILVGLKVFDDKVYCDYDRVYLKSQSGQNIQLMAVCWTRHEYEDFTSHNQRLKSLPNLPLGLAKPVRNEYNLDNQCLPFKTALYKYVQSIINFDKVFAIVDRDKAKKICTYKDNFKIYGNVEAMLNADEWNVTVKNDDYIIECKNKLNEIEEKITTGKDSDESENAYQRAVNYLSNNDSHSYAKNWEKALKFFEYAAELGHEGAKLKLKRLRGY